MSVYVDQLLNHGWVMRGRKIRSCHLFGGTIEELHAFAASIGLKREWFQNDSWPHYDLTPERREMALACREGASNVVLCQGCADKAIAQEPRP